MDKDDKRKYLDIKDKIGFHVGRLVSYPVNPPEHVYFSLTNRCNLRCQMCSVYKNPSTHESELSLEKIKEIVLEIKKMGIRHIIFSGGDPFMRKDLFEILEFTIKSEVEMVDLITNGTLLSEEQIKRLVEMKLSHVTFSLDGIGPTNDAIRGQGVFAKAEASIDRINHYKSMFNCSSPSVGINFTIMDQNVQDILPMIEFARKKQCNIILFQPIMFNNSKMSEKKTNHLWLKEESLERLEAVLNKVLELKNTTDQPYICTGDKILRTIPDYFKGKRAPVEFRCYEGFKRIVITCEGHLWSCPGSYGDLNRQSLKEIWFSEKATRMRSQAKACKEHCLQDCVYFPSDILGELKGFLATYNEKDVVAKEIKEKLLETIALFGRDIESLRKKSPGNFSVYFNSKRALMDLFLMRQEVMKH